MRKEYVERLEVELTAKDDSRKAPEYFNKVRSWATALTLWMKLHAKIG